MDEKDVKYFSLLKLRVAETYNLSYPGNTKRIEDWKGQEILNLQDDLLAKAKGQISEKWFYSHIKSENSDKLPRIDALNLLCRYSGYKDWYDFKSKNPLTEKDNKEISLKKTTNKKQSEKNRLKVILFVIFILFLLSIALYYIYKANTKDDNYKYSFCFIDADNQQLLKDLKINITILNKNESPLRKECVNGCFEVNSSEPKLIFVVNAPYYKTDTFTRIFNKETCKEQIMLKTDDYALMLHYFSKTKLSDWKNRRNQLEKKISDDAMIFQVYDANEKGMEILNKEDFINKLTMPLNSLKNIEIIEITYLNNKINSLRFRQIE